ncbi:MAG: RHS repeat-associated core domain-containing protein [Hellea sp.]
MRKILKFVGFCFLIYCTSSFHAYAQSGVTGGDPAPPLGDIQSRYNSYNLDVLGNDLMGDHTDIDTGALSITHTDVSIPGNFELPVEFGRTLSRTLVGAEWLGNWKANIPYISRNYLAEKPPGSDRCTGELYPSPIDYNNETIYAPSYFDGFNLSIPGRSTGKLTQALNGGNSPEFSSTSARMVTKDNWLVECTTVAGLGEAYIAVAPNGDRYTFAKRETYYERPMEVSPNLTVEVRDEVFYVTEVTDVNDNWVRYVYTGANITKIHSKDFREINIKYSGGRISEVQGPQVVKSDLTLATRIWKYDYTGGRLSKVTLPDARFWEFAFALNSEAVISDPFDAGITGLCAAHNSVNFLSDLIIKHPSGTTAEFNFTVIMNGRTKMDMYIRDTGMAHPTLEQCFVGDPAFKNASGFYSVAVTQKELTLINNGPTYVWTRGYEQDFGNYNGGSTHGYLDVKKRTVTDPLGHKTVSYLNRRFNQYEGTLEKVEIIPAGSNTPVQTTVNTYEDGNAVGIPLSATENFGATNFSDNTRIYLQKTVITRGTDTFTTEMSYNTEPDETVIPTPPPFSYGSPTLTKSYSSIDTDPREIITTYEHKKTEWVLNLPKTISQKDGAAGGETRLVSSYDYDDLGQTEKQYRYGDKVAEYSYNSDGTINLFKDALDRKTEPGLWKRGKPQSVKQAVGSPEEVTYGQTIDDNGWVTSKTDGRLHTRSYQRDMMGRLTKITPSGDVINLSPTNITYTFGANFIHQRIDKGYERKTISYDSLHRPIQETTVVRPLPNTSQVALYSTVRTEYDALGKAVFKSYPYQPINNPNFSDGIMSEYDALGRMKKTWASVDTTVSTTYDYLTGDCTKITDAEGNETTTCKNGYGGPGSGEILTISQPLGITTTLTHNNFGELLNVNQTGTQGGNQTQNYYYNDKGRLCRSFVPEAGNTLYGYDIAGQMISYQKGVEDNESDCDFPVDDALRVNLTYDGLGRPKKTDFVDNATPDIWRDYDLDGNVTHVLRGQDTKTYDAYGNNTCLSTAVCWFYEYDEHNRLKAEELQVDEIPFELKYLYNIYGYRHRMTLPTGRIVPLVNDGAGRSLLIGWAGDAFADAFQYHPNGQVKHFRYGNDLQYNSYLNNQQQTRRIFTREPATETTPEVKTVDLWYVFDKNGRITEQNDYVDHANDRTYGYDAVGRLTSANSTNWGNASYNYDGLGNLMSKSFSNWDGAPRTVTNAYDTLNRIESSDDDTKALYNFSHDTRGNVILTGGLGFTYDVSDQPIAMSGIAPNTGTNITGSYVYDGNMKRVKSIMNGVTRYNVYDQGGKLVHVEELDDPNIPGDQSSQTDYLNAAGMTIARIKNSATENGVFTYLHPDHLGSPVAGTSEDALVTFTERFTPFGETLINPAANDNQSGFTGHIKDADVGLNYMQARYYDPNVGRFLSIDPVTFMDLPEPGMFNRYAYTLNDPMNNTDPTGMCIPCIPPGVALADGKKARKIASEQAQLYPGVDDEGDAMRHATTSKRLSEELITGRLGAKILGDANEVKGQNSENAAGEKNTPLQSAMDFINNAEGRAADAEGREIDPANLVIIEEDENGEKRIVPFPLPKDTGERE